MPLLHSLWMNPDTASLALSYSTLPWSTSSFGVIGLLRCQASRTFPSGRLARKNPSKTISPGCQGFAFGGNTFQADASRPLRLPQTKPHWNQAFAARAYSNGAKLQASQVG